MFEIVKNLTGLVASTGVASIAYNAVKTFKPKTTTFRSKMATELGAFVITAIVSDAAYEKVASYFDHGKAYVDAVAKTREGILNKADAAVKEAEKKFEEGCDVDGTADSE